MLELLRISNLALIKDMELEFSAGMNVLTGETGAGKTFILKALSFLLGDKLPVQIIRSGADKAEVTGLFVRDGQELIIRRELPAETGRSRLYINDVLSSQEALKGLRQTLILHTSQHGQQRLLQPAFQDSLINDALARPDLLDKKSALVKSLTENAAARSALMKKYQSLVERRDLLEMQQQEIDAVAPEEGEEDRLEALRSEARDKALLQEQYNSALALLYGEGGGGLLDMLGEFEHLLRGMAASDASLMEDLDSVSGLRQNLQHLSTRLRRPPASAEANLEEVESRLFELAQLKRKLRRPLDEILAFRNEIVENLSFLDSCALDIKRFDKKEEALKSELSSVLRELAPLKRAAAATFSARLEQQLRDLGFSPEVHVHVEFFPHALYADLSEEKARLLWAPNPGQPPQPLDRIASGGELSRFLLALTSIQSGSDNATLIFDEVDAGVGGLTLNAVAAKLASLAADRQMLLITHWPQLAVTASRHFQVQKIVEGQSTSTVCQLLDKPARLLELSRMAGGGPQGQALAQSLLA